MATSPRTVERIDPIADPEWAGFLPRCPNQEIFHHPLWLELLRAQYGYEISAVVLRGADGEIEAGLPIARIKSRLTGKRLAALPFSDTCFPLVAAGAALETGAALGEAITDAAVEQGLGLTVHAPLEGVDPNSIFHCFVRHQLPLQEDIVEVGKFARSQVRRDVKRAEKEGLEFEIGRDRAALDAFYGLHLRTRRKLGVPTQPKRFIRRFERLFEEGLGFVGLVHDEGTPTAAGVFLACGDVLTYKYGASDERALAKRPNHLLHAGAIRWGCANGFGVYDMGRSDLDNAGLRRFKSSWGAAELDLSYTYVNTGTPVFGEPSRLDGLVAGVVTRSPLWVGRLAGEVFYRHFG